MKKCFVTGLALLMPVVITVIIVLFVVNLLTKPLLRPVSSLLSSTGLFDGSFLFLSGHHLLLIASKLVILVGLVLLTIFVGIAAQWFFLHYFVRFGEFFIFRIPLVNKIYKGAQDVVQTLFSNEKSNFSAVVLVPFPHPNARSIGLITSERAKEGSDKDLEEMVSVLVPGTPNPAMGFMLMFKREQLTLIDMPVQDAIKFVISCGVIGHKDAEDES